MERDWIRAGGDAPAGELITYAMSLMGTPYKYGGTTDSGFDCSGFTSHVFQEFGVPISRSSTTQSEDGIAVSRDEAQPGDLVIFTGTNPHVREPGHVGIVISEPGDTISFVHSSSNGGVKISQVEGTGYDVRFLGVRRVL
ncbi:C40 family peptidase [Pontibacter indicus]|uniref:C40 family peptidase n=1 Tax=Pontibacter indicus TaxID=1317125 RepID=UPI001FCE2BF2|nr:C40 family peptidase [Pontibacter indicus]